MKIPTTIFSLCLALSLSACVKLTSDTLKGNYTGTFATSNSKEVIPLHASLIADPDSTDSLKGTITCDDAKISCAYTFQIDRARRNRISVYLKGKTETQTLLSYDSESADSLSCFRNDQNELCVSVDQISFTYVDESLLKNTITLKPSTQAGSVSDSKDYLLTELMDRADHLDFSTRIEYQRYLESRYNAKAMLLAQLPHVNLGTIGNLLGGLNPSSLIQVVGDLLPFLLPNRWFQAREATWISRAEQESATIIRLNAILSTETLAYSYFRDVKAIDGLNTEAKVVSGIYHDLKTRETLGQLPLGTSKDISSILVGIEEAVLQLRTNTDLELQALAISVGFTNPHAIHSIKNDMKREISNPLLLTEEILRQQAIEQAHEIKQADDLYHAASLGRLEHFFSFLDPSAPPQYSIGLALFPATRSATAQIQEFNLIRQQITTQAESKAASLYTTLNFAVKNEALVSESSQIQTDRVNRILNQLKYGSNFAMADLVSALQDHVQAEINALGNEAMYQGTEAQIERLISRGIYQKYDDSGQNLQ